VQFFDDRMAGGDADAVAFESHNQGITCASMDNTAMIGTIVVLGGALIAWKFLPKRDAAKQ
jgi:hypothetical protein